MSEQVLGKVLVVGQGEALSNGGTKWLLVLDNGSQLVTFSEKCKDAVNQNIGVPLVFEVDPPPFEGAQPKVTKVMKDGQVIWQPSQGGGGGGGGDPIAQHARTAVITAGSIVAARANAYESEEDLVGAMARIAGAIAGLLKDVETQLRA